MDLSRRAAVGEADAAHGRFGLSGAEAARIGLVLQAVPAAELEATVEALADKMAMIDIDLLSANKRICNIALEMMGARTVQRMAARTSPRSPRAQRAGVRPHLAREGAEARARVARHQVRRRTRQRRRPGAQNGRHLTPDPFPEREGKLVWGRSLKKDRPPRER